MPLITVVSDLHIEFGYQELPGGEVLIVAGDLAEARSIKRHFHSTKPVGSTPSHAYRCSDFIEHEFKKYDKVFYVLGNHEHYHNRLDKTWHHLVEIVPDNVNILDEHCEEYKGVLFLGGTLWTDLNKGDWHTAYHLKQNMNDFHVIQNYYGMDEHYAPKIGRLTPEYTAGIHRHTLEYFQTILEQNRDKPVVVITHHAPSFASVNAKYKTDHLMNGGYASELSDFILANENIQLWCHGHMHDPVDYMIGNTRVVANPRGYLGHEDTGQFNPNFTVEI